MIAKSFGKELRVHANYIDIAMGCHYHGKRRSYHSPKNLVPTRVSSLYNFVPSTFFSSGCLGQAKVTQIRVTRLDFHFKLLENDAGRRSILFIIIVENVGKKLKT